jgi:hypothetical protein
MKRLFLPHVLNELVAVAGYEAMEAIVAAHGGTRVTVPMRPDGDNWLTRLQLGPEASKAIIDRFGEGSRLDVPTARSLTYLRREDDFDKLETEGASARVIARALGITDRAVRQRRARRREAVA